MARRAFTQLPESELKAEIVALREQANKIYHKICQFEGVLVAMSQPTYKDELKKYSERSPLHFFMAEVFKNPIVSTLDVVRGIYKKRYARTPSDFVSVHKEFVALYNKFHPQ